MNVRRFLLALLIVIWIESAHYWAGVFAERGNAAMAVVLLMPAAVAGGLLAAWGGAER
jgi:hypothetical protein